MMVSGLEHSSYMRDLCMSFAVSPTSSNKSTWSISGFVLLKGDNLTTGSSKLMVPSEILGLHKFRWFKFYTGFYHPTAPTNQKRSGVSGWG